MTKPLAPPPPISSQGFNDPAFQNWLYLFYQKTTTDVASATTQANAPIAAAQMPGLTGDVTMPAGSTVTTLAMVNSAPGNYGDSNNVPSFTVNDKGLITDISSVPASSNAGITSMDGEDGMDSYIPGPQGIQGIAGTSTNGMDGEDGMDSYIPGPQGIQGIQGIAGVSVFGMDGEEGMDSYIPGPAGPQGIPGTSFLYQIRAVSSLRL